MLDVAEKGTGPIFVVDSVPEFHDRHRNELAFAGPPQEIPGGSMATFTDPWGNVMHVLDQSTMEAEGPAVTTDPAAVTEDRSPRR